MFRIVVFSNESDFFNGIGTLIYEVTHERVAVSIANDLLTEHNVVMIEGEGRRREFISHGYTLLNELL